MAAGEDAQLLETLKLLRTGAGKGGQLKQELPAVGIDPQVLEVPLCEKVVMDDGGQALLFRTRVMRHLRKWNVTLMYADNAHFY